MSELEWMAAIAGLMGGIAAFLKATQYVWRWLAPKVRKVFKKMVEYDTLREDVAEIEKTGQKLMAGLTTVLNEIRPNGGASMRDAINRIESRQIQLDGYNQVMMHEHSHAVFKADAEGLWTWVNRKYSRIGNTTLEEVKGTGWVNCVHRDDREAVEQEWNRAVQEHRAFNMNYRMITPDGRVTPVKCTSYRLENPDGTTVGYVGIIAKESISKLPVEPKKSA